MLLENSNIKSVAFKNFSTTLLFHFHTVKNIKLLKMNIHVQEWRFVFFFRQTSSLIWFDKLLHN